MVLPKYDSPLPVFAEKKPCIIVLIFCNIIALKLLVKDRSAGPVLRDISMTSLQNVSPGYARKNWLVHPSNSLIRSKIEEYMKCQIATKLFYFHSPTIHSSTNQWLKFRNFVVSETCVPEKVQIPRVCLLVFCFSAKKE